MKEFIKGFVKDCMLFQCKDKETIVLGVLAWGSIIGMVAIILIYK